jgi:hypothetical protein
MFGKDPLSKSVFLPTDLGMKTKQQNEELKTDEAGVTTEQDPLRQSVQLWNSQKGLSKSVATGFLNGEEQQLMRKVQQGLRFHATQNPLYQEIHTNYKQSLGELLTQIRELNKSESLIFVVRNHTTLAERQLHHTIFDLNNCNIPMLVLAELDEKNRDKASGGPDGPHFDTLNYHVNMHIPKTIVPPYVCIKNLDVNDRNQFYESYMQRFYSSLRFIEEVKSRIENKTPLSQKNYGVALFLRSCLCPQGVKFAEVHDNNRLFRWTRQTEEVQKAEGMAIQYLTGRKRTSGDLSESSAAGNSSRLGKSASLVDSSLRKRYPPCYDRIYDMTTQDYQAYLSENFETS